LPERPIRPLWSAGNKNKQHNRPSNIHHLPSPIPHPHHHHHSPCQPPPTTFLQVLDHPHSKLGVGGQAPTPPSYLEVAGQTPCIQAKRGCGTGAQARENPTPTTPANTTASRHPAHTQLPCADPTAAEPGLSAVTYGKARGGRGDRPERASFGCSSESCLPKKRRPSHPHAETYLCSAPRTKPTPPDPPFFSRLKIVLGSLGIDPGAGALPGFDGEDGRLIGRSAIAMRLAQRRRQDQRSRERVRQAPRPRTKTSA
jgi:hypothetical protein